MSRLIVFDCETLALPEEKLLAMMPPEMANPIMPAELDKFEEPDLSACPKYSGDTAKQETWRVETRNKAKSKWMQAREVWSQKAEDAKAKFIADSALYAERASLKLMSFRENGLTECLVIGATPEERAKIEAEKWGSLSAHFQWFQEKGALDYFHQWTLANIGKAFKAKLCGYYLAQFDIPFALRREMILGMPVSRHLYRTPRYVDEESVCDLWDMWTFGNRDVHTGGLAGLAKILGVKEKTSTGEGFGALWKADPVAAIKYNLSELITIEQVAARMGVA